MLKKIIVERVLIDPFYLSKIRRFGTQKGEVIRELLEGKFGNKQYEQVENKVMHKDSGNSWSIVHFFLPIIRDYAKKSVN